MVEAGTIVGYLQHHFRAFATLMDFAVAGSDAPPELMAAFGELLDAPAVEGAA